MFTYKLTEVRTKHEFHSLATQPLTATVKDQLTWQPPVAGVEFRAVPGSLVPADSARQRFVQMKAIAREFSASLINEKGTPSELRLLSQPQELPVQTCPFVQQWPC